MNYDKIIIAGTSESRTVIENELKYNEKLLACVATDLGAEMLQQYPIDIHIGRLDEDGFKKLFRENPCNEVIDASHPFAKIVTDTVQKAAKEMGISYKRLERQELVYDYDKIYYVSDAKEAVKKINELKGNVLLTTGVNTANIYFSGVKDAQERLYIRVLDTLASYEGCDKAGYDKTHVFGEMPPYSEEDNLERIYQINAKILVTKDSGKTGGVDVKAAACKAAGIDMIIIKRPE